MTTLDRWVMAGDKTLNVGVCVVTLGVSRGEYVLTTRDDDGLETETADELDSLSPEWTVGLAEDAQRERIQSAAADAATSLLETLLEQGKAMDVLKALRSL